MFLFTPDQPTRGMPLLEAAREGGWSLLDTVRRLRRFGNALLYLIAFMLYNDGLAAIIAFGGVYAAATFGWSTVDARHLRHHPDGVRHPRRLSRRQARRPLRQQAHRAGRPSLGVIVATIGIVGVSADRVLFFVPAPELSPDRGLFGSLQEKVFMAFALLLGICMGPMQAASRTMIGRLAPEGMSGEFFGLFALSGRATAWMAPLAIGIVTTATHSRRLGVACVLIFLVLGFVLLWQVREERAEA